MRVVWVVPGGMDRSGRERVIPAQLWLAERLAARHDLHVVSLGERGAPADYALLGATIHALAPGRIPSRAVRLARMLRALCPCDVIHVFTAGHAALLTVVLARRLGSPVVVSLFGGELVGLADIGYGGALTRRRRALVRGVLRLAAKVTVASGPMEDLARPLREDAVRVPLGVDRRRFPGPDSDVSTPRAGPPWRLLHVGSINAVKDQSTLLRAFRRVVDEIPDASLDLVGPDTLGGALSRQAAELGFGSSVRFHGFQPSDVVARLLGQAHLFVMTSRHEAGPVAVLEAAACGVPAVGTAVGHIADLAPDAACGVPVGNAEALAAGIVALLRDSALRRRMGEAARAWARRHDADWTAACFETIYRDVGGPRP